jgi:predicted  nucleic acid-binding Zn-ribbon protein
MSEPGPAADVAPGAARSPLETLLAVQDLDTSIDQHRHHRAALPERAEISDLDAHGAELMRESRAAAAAVEEIAARQARAEAELAATEERKDSVSRRLYGGTVSASRELQAMAADVDSLAARAANLEDEVLAILEEREPLDARVASLQTERDALGARRGALVEALTEAEGRIDEEIATIEAERAPLAATVPPDLLDLYERLRARLGGIGAARLVGDRCSGCHLSLPATELDRIRHLPHGEAATCDQCGRILAH